MYSVPESNERSGIRSEKGFVLIAAIMGVMILLAVGFFALTISSSDLRIAAQLVGERKALSAAEAGIHDTCLNFSTSMAAVSNRQIDPDKDSTVYYSTTAPVSDPNIPSIGATGSSIEGGKSWSFNIYDMDVTGVDTAYKSSITLAVGFRHGEVPSTPIYQ